MIFMTVHRRMKWMILHMRIVSLFDIEDALYRKHSDMKIRNSEY